MKGICQNDSKLFFNRLKLYPIKLVAIVKISLILSIELMHVGCQISHDNLYRDLSECPVVAERKQIGSHRVIVCKPELMKDTITLPLSYFTEEMQIVKLDNAPEALVAGSDVTISEKYILVKHHWDSKTPYRLFDKSGKFLTDIGAFGKGPNEYNLIVDQQIDEKNNRIYLLPSRSDKILVYDLEGNHKAPIPLFNKSIKGAIHVDGERSNVSVISLPINEDLEFVWSQHMAGGLIGGLSPGKLKIESKLALNVFSFGNSNEVDFHITHANYPQKDTLYHYDPERNRLIPQFTIDLNDPIPIHIYTELPRHYICAFAKSKQVKTGLAITFVKYCVVEKKSLKGAYLKLENDFLGNISVLRPMFAFSARYFTHNMEPSILLENLEKTLVNDKLSAEMREKLTDLNNSIKEIDNNYILFAKLKQ
jgi:hypothetical protein